MAEVNKLFILLITISVCGLHEWGWALRVEMSPNNIDVLNPELVNVSCIPDAAIDQEGREVIVMEIINDSHGSHIVVLRKNNITTIKGSHPEKFAVRGHIDEVPSKSYLRLSLLNPTEKDAGLYKCVMFFTDFVGMMKEKKAEANLTMKNLDIKSQVEYLVNKVSSMDKELHNRTLKETFLANQVAMLENKLQTQIIAQNEKDKEHKSNISILENRLKDQMSKVHDLESVVSNCQKKELDLRADISNLDLKLNTHISKKNYISAFSARYSGKGFEASGDTVVFNDMIVEIGHDYDKNTGVFTASKPGVYGFHLIAMLKSSHGFIDLGVYVNNNLLSVLSMGSDDLNWDQSSTSLFVHLQVNDVVKVAVTGKKPENMAIRSYQFTVFTGYLFQETDTNTIS